jgi:MFS transporter, SP family, solute carrier family 2 (facilitated glucose transporter), member 1
LFIAVFLQLSQQLSGINAVFYYSTTIFKKTGLDSKEAEYANLGLGATNIFITVISVFLMDRLGRRALHLTGILGMFFTSLMLFFSLLVQSNDFWNKISLIMTILFVAFFGVGPGGIPWLITAELFNQAYRVPASSVAVLVNWSANFAVGLGFKPLFTVRSIGMMRHDHLKTIVLGILGHLHIHSLQFFSSDLFSPDIHLCPRNQRQNSGNDLHGNQPWRYLAS